MNDISMAVRVHRGGVASQFLQDTVVDPGFFEGVCVCGGGGGGANGNV